MISDHNSSPVRVIPCKEYGQIDIDPAEILTPTGGLKLSGSGLEKFVRADFKNGRVRLNATGVTGLLPLSENTIAQVRPRFPIRNLSHMVAACGYSPMIIEALREYSPTAHKADWLLDVLTDALLAALAVVRQNGMLRTYVRRSDSSSSPHGRINFAQTAMQFDARGIHYRASYSWFERTVDNAPNRCIRMALIRLHHHYASKPSTSGDRTRKARLADSLRVFAGASNDENLRCLDDPYVRGLQPLPTPRGYYRPALSIAVAILTQRGIDLDAFDGARLSAGLKPYTTDPGTTGTLTLPSLLIKTEDLFEEYVRLSLQLAFSADQSLQVLDGNKEEGRLPLYSALGQFELEGLPPHVKLDPESKDLRTQPDIAFREASRFPLIADVKYTNVDTFADRSEVEQVVLYGLRYHSPVVMTIHPKQRGSERGLYVAGRIGQMLVTQYRVDLASQDLEAEMARMSEDIRSLIAATSIPH